MFNSIIWYDLSMEITDQKFGIIVNTKSGSSDDDSAGIIKEILVEYGITAAHTWCGSSEGLSDAFADVAKKDIDVLIVLGGDGTISSAAAQCTATGPILIPLPGGTMNILPKALYGTGSWQDILRAILTNPSVKRVSGGSVEGQRFYISAICGAPALWANAREALRDNAFGDVLAHSKVAIDHMFASKVSYDFGSGHTGSAEAITVTCPLVASELDEDQRLFQATVIDVNDAGDVLKLATAAAFGAWRELKNVEVVHTAGVMLSAEEDIPVILDGETVDVGHSTTITFVPNAFTALVPVMQKEEIAS